MAEVLKKIHGKVDEWEALYPIGGKLPERDEGDLHQHWGEGFTGRLETKSKRRESGRRCHDFDQKIEANTDSGKWYDFYFDMLEKSVRHPKTNLSKQTRYPNLEEVTGRLHVKLSALVPQ